MADASFSIDLAVKAEGVANAAELMDRFAEKLTLASKAAADAASATKAGEASYKSAETSYDRAQKALERINVAMQGASGATLERLTSRQAAASKTADAAKASLDKEAAALDKLRASSSAADKEVEKLTKAQSAAQKAIAEKTKEQNTAIKQDRVLEGSLNKLGGPLGALASKAVGVKTVWEKLSKAFGAAGPYIAIGAAIVAISVGVLLVTAAAIGGIASITAWAVRLADKNNQIGAAQTRLKNNINGLFSGLKIDGLLKGLNSVVDLFDKNMASGKAIKVVFESIFQPIVDGATAMIPKVRHAFLEFEILALKALIAIKPYGSTILKVIEAVVILSAVVIGVLVVAIAAVVAILAAAVVGFLYVSSVLANFGKSVVAEFGKARAFLASFSLADLGTAIMQGLANGLKAGAGAVVDAVKSAATQAIAAAKKALGVASPSKVFAEIGVQTGAGMQQGVERSSGAVQSAMVDMVAAPAAAPPDAPPSPAAPALGRVSQQAPAAPAASQSSGGGTTYTIIIQAASGAAQDIADAVRGVMIDISKGAAIQLGAGVPA